MLISSSKAINPPEIFINYNSPDAVQNSNLITRMNYINDSENPYAKFLGVLIDPNFSFKPHINSINKKISSALFFMRRAKNLLSERALKFIYYSLFHSQLIYANQLWSCCQESLLKPLITKQKMAIRIVANAKYNSHTEPLFKKLNILPFNNLCEYFKIQFMQQFVQKFHPKALENLWITNSMRHMDDDHVTLRNDDQLYIPFARTALTSRLPLTTFPRLWCDFPDEDIKFVRNKKEFNLKLKNHFISKLSTTIQCNRLLCPDCHLNV
jgi:hypothetical protein